MRSSFLSALLVSLLALTACSSYAPSAELVAGGKDQVLARMGQPETQRPLGGGITRLEYPTGPYGLHTWFVDVDASGKVVQSQQVLTTQQFNQIMPDMDQAEVRQRLGRPNGVFTLGRARGEVWNYRFEGPFCEWFQVEMSAEKRVRSAGYATRPECEHHDPLIVP